MAKFIYPLLRPNLLAAQGINGNHNVVQTEISLNLLQEITNIYALKSNKIQIYVNFFGH